MRAAINTLEREHGLGGCATPCSQCELIDVALVKRNLPVGVPCPTPEALRDLRARLEQEMASHLLAANKRARQRRAERRGRGRGRGSA